MEKDQKAIALHYDNEKDNAPVILSKGHGLIAEKIIEIAKSFDIPIYEDKILSDILDTVKTGYEVPEYLYEVIAEIYAFTYQVMKKESSTS